MSMSIPETIAANPELVIVAGLVLRGILAWQRGLSWYEYRTLHGLKRFMAARYPRDTIGPISLVNRKTGPGDDEFLLHSRASPREMVRELRSHGFSFHLLASLKIRDGGQASYTQLVYTHDDRTQTEVYLFPSAGGTDLYAHHETSAGSIRHLTDTNQVPGDPRGVVPEVLHES